MKHFQMFGKEPGPIQHIIGEYFNVFIRWIINSQIFKQGESIRCPICVTAESLHWDSFEQFCVWQLMSAESPDCQLVIPALTDLDPEGMHTL